MASGGRTPLRVGATETIIGFELPKWQRASSVSSRRIIAAGEAWFLAEVLP